MNPILDVRNLQVKFQTHGKLLHAVRDVSFSIRPGETLGIVGESGCGKSATAKALLQLHPSHTSKVSGDILYQGENLLSFAERKMQSIRGKEMGMIFQDPMTSLNPTLKIGDQIIEGYLRHFHRSSYKEAKKIALETLEKVGIENPSERFESYPHTLSGGMRQRVMIAVALACSPKILIADEPTTALDVTIQSQILELLKQIQKQTQTSILIITHDMSVIAQTCDRVIVMYAGKIIESAETHRLFASPLHPYTTRLLSSIPRLSQSKKDPLIPIEGTPPNLSNPLLGCAFCARCHEAMRICLKEQPPFIEVSSRHFSSCFKYDPRLKND